MTGLCSFYKIQNPQAGNNLHDYWGSSMGMFGALTYPLKSIDSVSTHSDSIMKTHTRESLATDLKDVSKKSWSDKSFEIAKTHAYVLQEGTAPSTAYISNGKELIKKQIALAAYRIVDQIIYCMKAQKPRAKKNEVNS